MVDIFENAKVGDDVFYMYGSFGSTTLKPAKITKISKTMISIDISTSRYHKNGYKISSERWGGSDRILPYTEERKKQYEIQLKKNKMLKIYDSIPQRNKLLYLPEDKIDKVIELLSLLSDEIEKDINKE